MIDKREEIMARVVLGRINPDKCEHCPRASRRDGIDACLGRLPGVMNACCGHGKPEMAYVQFSPRFRIAGRIALAGQWLLKAVRSRKYGESYCFTKAELRELGKY